jgi:perosamine synthetase
LDSRKKLLVGFDYYWEGYKMIQINLPQIDEQEIEAVIKVLKTGVLTNGLGEGPMVTAFERSFAKFVNAKHAIAMNSGTAALHSALVGAGLEKGDDVILPSFTFAATAEVVVMVGASPVFVDVDSDTYTVSAKTIEKALTKKTKVVMPVDLYGLPADMLPIRKLADEHGLKIVEDSAQAHGASYKGKAVGGYSDAACWSFYGSKNMTTGEGGMITTNKEEIAEMSRCIRNHGEKEKYQSLMLGHNYRMPEIEAAIGCAQLAKLPEFVARRRKNAEKLSQILRTSKKLQLPTEPKGFRHSWYLYTVRLKNAKRDERDKVVEKLKKKGIGAFVYYMHPIHLMPFYKKFGKHVLPETEKAAEQVFSLPVHPGVTAEQIDFIGATLLNLVK